MIPPKPRARPERVSLWRYLRLFRQDILSAQPAKLYRAWMAEFRTPFFRSFLVNQPELVKTVLRDRPMDFPKSDRIGEGLRPLLGDSVFLTNGADWQRQRRIIDPAFEGGRLKDTFPAMVAAAAIAGEVHDSFRALRDVGGELLTLGQYLAPGSGYHPVREFIPPERFEALAQQAKALGFRAVASGPLVRSSYRAESLLAAARGEKARCALRINPDVDAGTHEKISTGKADNKFGVPLHRAADAFAELAALDGLALEGLALHIRGRRAHCSSRFRNIGYRRL